MVSKEELRKLDKEELVDFAHKLSLQVDQLTNEVKELREEIRVLKNKKNSGNSPSLTEVYYRSGSANVSDFAGLSCGL